MPAHTIAQRTPYTSRTVPSRTARTPVSRPVPVDRPLGLDGGRVHAPDPTHRPGAGASSDADDARRKRVVIAFIAAAALVLAAILVYPSAQQYYQTYRENQRLQAEYLAIESRNAEIQSNIDYLNTDAGIEDQARQYGWVEQGENSVSVSGTGEDDVTTTVPDEVKSDSIEPPHTWITNILDPVFGVS